MANQGLEAKRERHASLPPTRLAPLAPPPPPHPVLKTKRGPEPVAWRAAATCATLSATRVWLKPFGSLRRQGARGRSVGGKPGDGGGGRESTAGTRGLHPPLPGGV